jgi:hypothetical protein
MFTIDMKDFLYTVRNTETLSCDLLQQY